MDFLDSTIVFKLRFIKRSLLYFDYDSHRLGKFIVHEINSSSAKKVVALLKGGSRPLQSTDKVFILKSHNSRLDDLKEFIKQAGAKVTSKIDRATVLLGNNNIISNGDSYYSTSKYIHVPNGCNIHLNNEYNADYLQHGQHGGLRFTHDDLVVNDESIIDKTAIVYSESYQDKYDGHFTSYSHRVRATDADCYLTGYAVDIIYRILSQKLSVLNEHALLDSQSQSNIIDENNYKVLDGMLCGSDEDILTAQTIIYNCNVDKSFYWIKKLAEKHDSTIINNKKKAYKTFLSRLNVEHIYTISAMATWDFIKECILRDVFYDNVRETLEKQLDVDIRQDIARITTREYDECVNIEYSIDFNKLIEHVKS